MANESTTSPDTSEDRDVEIEMTIIEMPEASYQEHRALFEKPKISSKNDSIRNFLKSVKNLPDTNEPLSQGIRTRASEGASMAITKPFKYATQFSETGRPTGFSSEREEFFFETQPRVSGDIVSIDGTLLVSEFHGFSEGKTRTPIFQIKEAHIAHKLQPDEAAIIPIQWEKAQISANSDPFSSTRTDEPIPNGKRMIILLKAESHPARKRYSSAEAARLFPELLENTRLKEREFRDTSLSDVVASIVKEVQNTTQSESLSIGFAFPPDAAAFVLNTKGLTAREAFAEIEKQTGLMCTIQGNHLSFASADQETPEEKSSSGGPPMAYPCPKNPAF